MKFTFLKNTFWGQTPKLTLQIGSAILKNMLVISMYSIGVASAFADGSGGEMGGGGFTVYCNSTGEGTAFPKPGNYVYDYAIGKVDNQDWYVYQNDPIRHIEKVSEILRDATGNYFEISKNLLNDNPPSQWAKLDFPLALTEEVDFSLLPHNCLQDLADDPDEALSLAQAKAQQIVTYSPKDHEFYVDFSGIVAVVAQLGVRQKSALYEHEHLRWLKFSYGHVAEIAKWNRVIHTKEFFEKQGMDLLNYLNTQIHFSEKDFSDLVRAFNYHQEQNAIAVRLASIQHQFYNEYKSAPNKKQFLEDAVKSINPSPMELINKIYVRNKSLQFAKDKCAAFNLINNDNKTNMLPIVDRVEAKVIGLKYVLDNERVKALERSRDGEVGSDSDQFYKSLFMEMTWLENIQTQLLKLVSTSFMGNSTLDNIRKMINEFETENRSICFEQ